MKFLTSLPLAIFCVLAPVSPVLATALILVVVDLLTGVVAAKKKGEVINSRGLRRSVTKLFIYEIALMVAFLAGQYLLMELPVLKIVASMIGLTELRSVFENLSVISDEPVIKLLVGKLGGTEEKK